jgi:hypothetical protein
MIRGTWLGRPLAHFLALGAALFGLDVWLRPSGELVERGEAPPPVVITAKRVEQIRADFVRNSGMQLTSEHREALIRREIDEELLYREALARGLDRWDRSIRYRLVQKMRFLKDAPEGAEEELHREALELGLGRDDVVVRRILIQKMRLIAGISGEGKEPTEAELREYLNRHRDKYLLPARVTLFHVFLSAQGRGSMLKRDAEALLRKLESDAIRPEHSERYGDLFPLGASVGSASRRHLEKLYGPIFAREVMMLPAGAWSGPVSSSYGLHLVWVETHEAARETSLDSVRSQISHRLRAERRDASAREFLERLRQAYTVRVEQPPEDDT